MRVSHLLATIILAALALPALAQDAPMRKVLVLSKTAGFRHTTCSYGKPILTRVCEESGKFAATCTEDSRFINDDYLADVTCLVLNNTTGSFYTDEQKAALLKYVREGGAVVGIHSATDSHYDWPEYRELMGGWFDGHPWHEEVTIKIEQPGHPACRHLGDEWVIVDEIYQHRNWNRDELCVLMSLDPDGTDFTKPNMKREDKDYATAWCRPYLGRAPWWAVHAH